MASCKSKTYQIQPKTYVVFVFQLDDESEIVKKTISVVKEMFLAATLVEWTERSQISR